MAAKSVANISFSCSRQLLKCSFCFSFIPKTGKLTSNEQFCSGIGWKMAESNNGMQLSCVPKGCKIKRKFTSFFSIPLASVLLTSVFGLTGFCGENDDDDVSTPAKRPFFRSRTLKGWWKRPVTSPSWPTSFPTKKQASTIFSTEID